MGTLDLNKLLELDYGNTFQFHPKFVEEFVDNIRRSGNAKKILKQFFNRLRMIIELGDIDYGLPWLEHLKEYGNIYSLHLDEGSTNYRLLYSKNNDGKYFLRMFYEREGKDATSYKKNVPIAISRRDNK